MTRKLGPLLAIALISSVAIALAAYFFWDGPPPPEPEPTAQDTIRGETPQPRELPPHNFPIAVDESIKFEDYLSADPDEINSSRRFEIPLADGSKHPLMAIYLDEPYWKDSAHNEEGLITGIFDANAAFSGAVTLELPTAGRWERIRAHVGDFAQDYCGDVSVLYSFRNAGIFAVAAVAPGEIDLSSSQCPLKPEDYTANKAKYEKTDEPDDFSAFCTIRRSCLKAYYERPENQERLQTRWLKTVAEVELR